MVVWTTLLGIDGLLAAARPGAITVKKGGGVLRSIDRGTTSLQAWARMSMRENDDMTGDEQRAVRRSASSNGPKRFIDTEYMLQGF